MAEVPLEGASAPPPVVLPVVLRTVAEWRALRATLGGRPVAFVPTMGALHAGHAELFRSARCSRSDFVLISIFVNPTQFDEARDFETYARTLEADRALAGSAGVDAVFAPSVEEMYPNGTRYTAQEAGPVSRTLEGAHRPGHFTGMLTVVLKLLLIAEAARACFGEKDWQQLELVRGLVDAFHLPTRIVAVPTVREADGLAMSSRNARLTPPERALAPKFFEALTREPTPAGARALLEAAGFLVDYVEDCDERRLGAVRLGATRLIDNVPLAGAAEGAGAGVAAAAMTGVALGPGAPVLPP